MGKDPERDTPPSAKARARQAGAMTEHRHDSREESLGFERLISDLLSGFVSILDSETDPKIEDALRRICLYLELDQGLIVHWGRDGALPLPTHSWTALAGMSVPVSPGTEVMPWVHGQAALGRMIKFSRLEELPEEAERDKEFFRESGQKSLISLPLKNEGEVVGALVFASLHTEILWSDEVVRRLKTLADVFAGVLHRQESKRQLKERLRFEALLFDVSARFVNIPPEEVEREIEQSLKQVLEFFRIDRCGLLKTMPDGKSWQVVLAAYAEGIPLVPEKTNLPLTLFPWAAGQLLHERKVVYFKSIDELPPAAHIDRQSYQAWGMKSALTIPILIGGPVTYVLTIGAISHERAWSEDYIPRLRLLGEVLVNALERARIDTALRESEERLSLAADSAGAMLWHLRIDSGQIWATELAKKFFGFTPNSEMDFEGFLSVVHDEDREKVRQTVQKAMLTGNDGSVEYRIVRPDGSIRWVQSRGRPYPATMQEPARMMGVSLDVTDRRQAEALTPRQREVLQLFAEGHSAKEIATLLKISMRTVEFHKYRMMTHLGLKSTADIVRFAVKHGLSSQ